jgi:ubiquinone/menaquinone biosynthesis C-methylase UbiE
MTQAQFNEDQYRELSHKQWEQTAAGWHKWRPILDRWEESFTEQIFDLTGITPNSRVLEVAAGDGSFSMKVAQRVGSSGHVLSTDMAENMVSYASQAAKQAGHSHMEARVMDGENLTVDSDSFDVVICLLGLMLFANPQKGLAEAHRVLKSGGRYVATVLTTPDKTPWLAVPAKIAMQHANRPMPPPGTPGLFALGNMQQLEQLMLKAGFANIESHLLALPLKMSSAAECTVFIREIAGAIKGILAALDEEKQQAAWQAIEAALGQFEGENGFAAPGEIRLVVGTKEK